MHCRLRFQHFQPTVRLHTKRHCPFSVARCCCASDSSGAACKSYICDPAEHKPQHGVAAGSTRRFAIIGGGFAGVAVAHCLAASALAAQPTVLHLYDVAGLGSGGSGAAGGLLHPYSPKGKLLWKGQEAFEAALDLVAAAEHACKQTEACSEPFVWRKDILRPAADASQAAGFEVLQSGPVGTCASVQAIKAEQAHRLLPGLAPSALPSSSIGCQDSAVALLISGGLVVHPEKYLRHLWQSCVGLLTQLDNGSEACLRLQQVHSLAELEEQHGPYDAVVVAAGAAAGVLPEVEGLVAVLNSKDLLYVSWQNMQDMVNREELMRVDARKKELFAKRHMQRTCSTAGTLDLSARTAMKPSPAVVRSPAVTAIKVQGRSFQLMQPASAFGLMALTAGGRRGDSFGQSDVLPVRLSQGYGLELVPPSRPHPTPKEPSQESDSARANQLSSTSHHTEPTHQNIKQSGKNPHPVNSPQDQLNSTLHSSQFPEGAPSLVGATYMGVQGGQQICVGATKQFGFTAQQALQECGRQVTDPEEMAQAEALLRPRAEGLWDPASSWQVARVRSGVRALPQKTGDGAVPLAGKLPSGSDMHNWWIVGGFGARGLVYHAYLGKLLAQAILEGSEDGLPRQLLRWKSPSKRQQRFAGPVAAQKL